ncbi:hypothetical protein [Robiginitalea sp. SC105]|uniref:hypothetical protein n=1 Tax=Robiginitalea sp. SC105 TaxID=2762332 RepID=UPI00163B355D|nr:hypothetical protein [Robiginitalea sp. SC105]MBC2837990.1 hypothetical protein [Robiginitalea sp. SC105]
MIRHFLPLLLMLTGSSLFAQAYPPFGPDREVKFNAGLFLATGGAELSYEHYVGDDLSLGGTVYWDNDRYDYNGNFGIGPNLRAYFGYAPRSGFFAEAFGLYFKGEERVDYLPDTRVSERYNTFALGLGAGSKWTTRSQRFTLEFHGGVGRSLNPEPYQDEFIFRAGLNIGVRF